MCLFDYSVIIVTSVRYFCTGDPNKVTMACNSAVRLKTSIYALKYEKIRPLMQ